MVTIFFNKRHAFYLVGEGRSAHFSPFVINSMKKIKLESPCPAVALAEDGNTRIK